MSKHNLIASAIIVLMVLLNFSLYKVYEYSSVGNDDLSLIEVDLLKDRNLTDHELSLFEIPFDSNNYFVNAKKFRILGQTLNGNFHSKHQKMMEEQLLKWTKGVSNTLFDFKTKFNGKGLVMRVTDKTMKDAYASITAIRNALFSNLPIEIMYLENELNKNSQTILQTLPFVKLVSLTQAFPSVNLKDIGSGIRSFALLAASFDEVILADHDILFLQDPQVLFADVKYQETGALFFKDPLFSLTDYSLPWTKTLFDEKAMDYVKDLKFMKEESGDEQDAGVVVTKKSNRFYGLIATCWLNLKLKHKQSAAVIFQGEKETYWIGFATVHEPFSFTCSDCFGIAGVAAQNGYLCSSMIIHTDSKKVPMWVKRTQESRNDIPLLSHYVAAPGKWTLVLGEDHPCVKPENGPVLLSRENINADFVAQQTF